LKVKRQHSEAPINNTLIAVKHQQFENQLSLKKAVILTQLLAAIS
jgi:hypothetical protein